MDDIKNLLEKQAGVFEEFKKANDERIKAIESKGYAPADLEQKVDKINAEITNLSKELTEVAKKANRPAAGKDSTDPVKAEHKQAVMKYIRKGDDSGLAEAERKAMTVGSDPSGGYLVGEEIEAGIDKVAMATVAMLRLATVRNIGAASYKKRVRTSGAGYGWVGETEAPSETTTPQYAMLEFAPGTIYAEPQISSDLLEDAEVDVEAELMDSLNEEMAEGIGAALVTGTGIKKPRGLLAYDTVANASWAWGKIGYVPSGKAGAFADAAPSDKLIDLVHALKPAYRNGAAFMLNDLTLATIRKFKNGMGDYLWQPSLQAGVPGLLLGYPAETDDNMPDVGSNSLSIAFGNFKRAYVVVRRRGLAILRDPLTAKPFVKFYSTMRIGGGIQHFEAVKLMKFAAS
jgi:HK97 family phage major capsid protein